MARLIRHDARGPAIVEVNGRLIEICQCGLSKDKPFCDGSHSLVHGEEPGKMYVYTEARERVELVDMFPPPTKKYKPAD